MYLRKRYGESRIDGCPFCGKPSTSKNAQGVPVCISHKKLLLDGLRCVCGSFLDVMAGKWGAYCRCPKCGNVNFKRALEINQQLLKQQAPETQVEASTGPNRKSGNTRLRSRLNADLRRKAIWEPKAPEKKKEVVIRSDELHLYY